VSLWREAVETFLEVPVALQAAFWVIWFLMGILVGVAVS